MLSRRSSALAPSLLAALCALLAGSAFGSERGELGGPAIFLDRTEVYVINLDVMVSDAEGRPAGGLTRDDFVVLEDGEPVAVTNFYAVESGRVVGEALGVASEPPAAFADEPSAPARAAPDSLILFVDDTNLSPANRSRLFARLRDFLTESWRADLRVMVVSNDRELVIRQGFTTSPRDVYAALDRLEQMSVEGTQFELERTQLLERIAELNIEAGSGLFHTRGADAATSQEELEAEVRAQVTQVMPQIRSHSQRRFDQVRSTLGVLERFVDVLAGVPGRKAVVYASDGLPMRPGEELFEALANRASAIAELAPTLSSGLEVDRFDSTDEVERLVADANAAAVTFYALSAALPSGVRGADEARGLWSPRIASIEEASRHDSMRALASGTGGRAGFGGGVLRATLDGVLEDFDHRYSLGYATQRREGSPPRRLTVRLEPPRPGWTLRYRRSFQDQSADEEAVQRTLTALVLEAAENPLGIALEVPEVAARGDGTFEVPLLVSVPLGGLVLVPGEQHHVGQVSMYVAARDELGRTSPVNKHLCPVRIANSEVLVAMGRSAACGVRLLMRAGRQRLAVSVRDELAALDSTVAIDLELPPPALDASPAAVEGRR